MTETQVVKKKKNYWYTAEDIVDKAFTIVLLFLLLIGAYIIYDNIYVYYNASAERVKEIRPDIITEETLGEISEDAVAWVTLDDTSVDYPIMQGENNMEYLNKDAYGNYSLAGAIFLDSRNDPDFEDAYSLVYGHHMEKGLMFGALDAFYEKEYFDTHKTGTLSTKNDEYSLYVVAIISTDAKEDAIFDPESDLDIIGYINENAKYKRDVSKRKRIVALSTCKDPLTTERTVLICQIQE